MAILLKKRFKVQSLVDFGGLHIYKDSHDQNEYNQICSNQMDSTMNRYITNMGGMYAGYCFALMGPAHAFLFRGVRSTFMETRIPFTESKSNAEFAGNFILQTIIGSHGMIAYIGFQGFITLIGTLTLTV